MPTIQERRAAYRKKMQEWGDAESSKIERLRWRVTLLVLEEIPNAEITWLERVTPVSCGLEVRVRVGDYAAMGVLPREHFDDLEFTARMAASNLCELISKGQVAHWFET